MLKKPAILFACLLVAGLFVFGLTRLFELRYEQGDIYPPYSTLRADPLGASVFYESLDGMPGVSAEQYFERTLKEDRGDGRALFVLGARPYSLAFMSRAEFQTLRQFVFNGGRVVVGYFPEPKQTWSSREEEKEIADERKKAEDKARPEKKERRRTHRNRPKKSDDDEDEDWRAELKFVDLHEEWGFRPAFRSSNTATNEDAETRHSRFSRKSTDANASKSSEPTETAENAEIEAFTANLAVTNSALPSSITIHTALYFSRLTNGWTEIYADGKYPVVVERKFGKGSIVLVADSYPFSNEAMLKGRSPTLLAWMLGGGREAIFDEAHLGVVTDPGIAALMRKYRLHGLIFSLLILALLFIWKNSLSLVPPHAEAEVDAGPVVRGRDSTAGFVNLLRRSIAPANILSACHDEWRKTCARRTAISPAQWGEVHQLVQQQQTLEARERTPVQTYRAISEILKRKKI